MATLLQNSKLFKDNFETVLCIRCDTDFTFKEYLQHTPSCQPEGRSITEPTSVEDLKKQNLELICLPCKTNFPDIDTLLAHNPRNCEALLEDKKFGPRKNQPNIILKELYINLKNNSVSELVKLWRQHQTRKADIDEMRTCFSCKKLFESKSKLKKHIFTCAVRVSRRQGRSCEHCEAPFARPSALVKHYEKIHHVKTRVCNICKQNFASDEEINAHFVCLKDAVACLLRSP